MCIFLRFRECDKLNYLGVLDKLLEGYDRRATPTNHLSKYPCPSDLHPSCVARLNGTGKTC
ncbi:hypothetical protein E2C01_070254 [Portunus trituberculatus]|uniref:Uncharacterized protein n=1 Tax=Portunus trituberculatus TaxID=210409 RepID=A0A5B7I309_PORTR|nr:hypothetical protein [Portunus trituberculatus]